ncbi:MAG: transposase [Erythrobacter sp.]|nr:MAG: transposase [Erythrobacter sp.]
MIGTTSRRTSSPNGFIESLNARLRDEFLNETILTSLAHTRQELEVWRHDYNHFRPYSSLGNRTPAEMGAGSSGKPYRGHAPDAVVPITPSDGHQNGPRLYPLLVETSGSDHKAENSRPEWSDVG